MSLAVRHDRDRAHTIPAAGLAGNRYRGKRDMAHDGSVNLGNQRDRQGAGSPQCANYKLLGVIAVGAIFESGDGDLCYCLDI